MPASPALTSSGQSTTARIELRPPRATDGAAVHALVAACAPLDRNSLYLNLLQCTHFAATCVLAEDADHPSGPLGFISGYLLPERPQTLFIWQVAASAAARGRGLAKAMLLELLRRPACTAVDRLETTITEANSASWALFRSLARTLECPLGQRVLFDRDVHFEGQHDSEVLVTIGPFALPPAAANPERSTR